MNFLKRTILAVLVLPVLLIVDTFKSGKSLVKKIGLTLVVLIFFTFTWVSGYRNLVRVAGITLYEAGITDKLEEVQVSGTSMLPTIEDGETLALHNPNRYKIERGDIVSFSNVETGAYGYIKRVIGLSGETITVENGIVKIDGTPLKESYVYQDAPTYGNTYLVECKEYKIPRGKIAVLGDNRVASTDSRVIGFVSVEDVDGIIKSEEKPELTYNVDEKVAQDVNLNIDKFISNINEERLEKERGRLQKHSILMDIADKRAGLVSENIETWKSLEQDSEELLSSAGYEYFLTQEVVTFGPYDADQLAQHVFELRPYNYDFLSTNYYDIGVATKKGVSGACTVPVNVIILGWPTDPDYSQDVLQSWEDDINYLQQVISALNKLKSNPAIDSQETAEIVTLLTELLNQANQFQSIVLSNQWLTNTESLALEDYTQKTAEVQAKLGDYVRKYENDIADEEILTTLSGFKWGNAEFNKEADNAKLYWTSGDYESQLESARKAKNLAANDDELAIANYWEGLAYYNLGRHLQAEQALEKAIELDDDYAAPYVTLSAVAFSNYEYELGLQYATKCVELDPEYGWCHNNLGLAHAYLGNYDKAIESLERAVSIAPDSYVFNENLKRVRDSI